MVEKYRVHGPGQVDRVEVGGEVDQHGGEEDCGELVGYVDDGAYSFAHSNPTVISKVLTENYNVLEEWMNNNKFGNLPGQDPHHGDWH